MSHSKITRAAQALLVGAFCSFFSNSNGQTFQLGSVLNGSPPSSSGPWLTATFTSLFPGTVSLTLESHLDVPSEYIADFAFNLNPSLSPAGLTFTQTAGAPNSQILQPTGGDTVTLPGGGSSGKGFDILISWPSGGGSTRFDGSQICTFNISGPSTLTPQDFLFYNSINGQDGPAILAAHIQGIPVIGGGTTSSAIIQTVPEPAAATMALLALGIALARRKKSRRPNGP
jgi:hypothetical protein